MYSVNLQFHEVDFSYDGAQSTAGQNQKSYSVLSANTGEDFSLKNLNLHFARGWTGIVGPNGAGKSTLAKLAAGLVAPQKGVIRGLEGANALYCEQQCEDIPLHFEEFFFSEGSQAGSLRSLLGIQDEWMGRWHSLSFGERKRVQLAIALWRDSPLLVVDEPVNHIDAYAKELITSALSRYRGTGIVVAHDRDFLDALCTNCVFMRPGCVVVRPGNYSQGLEQQMFEDSTREQRYFLMLDKAKVAAQSARSMKQRESVKSGKLSKKHLAKHDHDAKSKVDGARLSGKDKRGARKVTLLERKSESLKEEAQQNHFRSRKVESVFFEGEVLQCDRLCAIEAFRLPLGDRRSVDIPLLEIGPEDRIAICGDNGSGKSTLLRAIVTAISLSPDRFIYMPQEITRDEWDGLRAKLRRVSGDMLGRMMSIVHRLGSEPDRILTNAEPSPGEKRKTLLALGLLGRPNLIIMDEPTNHLDLPSIEALEEALSRFRAALVVVSHDQRFLSKLTDIRWIFDAGGFVIRR